MNKKIKYLSLLGLTLILSGCFDSVSNEINREVRNAKELTTEQQKQEAFNAITASKLPSAMNDDHVLSISAEFAGTWPLWTSISGYGYYDYNSSDDTATFKFSNGSNPRTDINLEADQTLDVSVNVLGLNLYNLENQQLTFDTKPLNQLLDFSILNSIDKSAILKYRQIERWEIEFDSIDGSWSGFVLDIDDQYINSLINSPILKFTSDVVVTFLYQDYYFSNYYIDIIHINGWVNINDTFNVELDAYIHNIE